MKLVLQLISITNKLTNIATNSVTNIATISVTNVIRESLDI